MSNSGRGREGCFNNRRHRRKPVLPTKPRNPFTDEHIRAMCPDGDGVYTDEDSIRSERKYRTESVHSTSSLGSLDTKSDSFAGDVGFSDSGFGSGNVVDPLPRRFQLPAPTRQTKPATAQHRRFLNESTTSSNIERASTSGVPSKNGVLKVTVASNRDPPRPVALSSSLPRSERFYSESDDPMRVKIRTLGPNDPILYVPRCIVNYIPHLAMLKKHLRPGGSNYVELDVEHALFLNILRLIDNACYKRPLGNYSDALLYDMYKFSVEFKCLFVTDFVTTELKKRKHYTTEELYNLYNFSNGWNLEDLREDCKTRLSKLRTAEALDIAVTLKLKDVKTTILRAMPIKALKDYFAMKHEFTEADHEIVAKKYAKKPRPQSSRTRRFAEPVVSQYEKIS